VLVHFIGVLLHLLLVGETTKLCSFHLVPPFEECSPCGNGNSEFNFWDLHGTVLILIVKGMKYELAILGAAINEQLVTCCTMSFVPCVVV
jgi:hypothetical protein